MKDEILMHCNQEIDPKLDIVTFKNGFEHIEARCPVCDKFLKYMPQDIDYTEVVMPFGKYKGQKIMDLPEEYLYWLIEEEVVKGNLKKSIELLFSPKI